MAQIAATALTAAQAEFYFEAGSCSTEDLGVLALEHQEEISRLFKLDVTLAAHGDRAVDPASLIGKDALLTVQHGDGTARFVSGIVSEVNRWEEGTRDRRRVGIRVVPKLWKLGRIQRSRIFQHKTAPEIVETVLREGGIDFRPSLSASYLTRDYCVQYRETDLDFIFRLLEEEGIFTWFEHEQTKHTLVLGDTSSAYGATSGPIVFREKSKTVADREFIDRFSAGVRLRPGKVALRDYNPLFPGVDMNAERSAKDGDLALEVYDYPGNYLDAGAGKTVARIRLEEARVRASICSGSGISRRLVPGCVFELEEHPIDELNGEYLVVSVTHRAEQPEVLGAGFVRESAPEEYRNQFACIRKEIPFRPERRTARPVIPGAQTALVVGPSGEEIHTDAYGRIKVQFHWDREGKKDENSSCWIRVSQSWAGSGWGALYLPRIGQEVVVEFLEGDPDRPLVTGSVYNGQNPVPIALPGEKTKSTLRSATSPGSNGSNELRFEDAAGSEEIYFHAQKDLNIAVLNDKAQEVGGNEKLSVKKNRDREVGGKQTLKVGGDDSSVIGGTQDVKVAKDCVTSIGGSHSVTVGGGQAITAGAGFSLSVGGVAIETVGGTKIVKAGAAYSVSVGAAMTEAIGGLRSEEVGGGKTESVGGDKTEHIGGSRSLDVGGDLTEAVGASKTLKIAKDFKENVDGKLEIGVNQKYKVKAKAITLSAEEDFLIQVGSAKLQVKSNGDILVKGSKVEVNASGDVVIKGAKIEEN